MQILSSTFLFTFLSTLLCVLVPSFGDTISCNYRYSPCRGRVLECPKECPSERPRNPKSKVCCLNCYSPLCEPQCKRPKPNCEGPGSACLDPRFIGGDGTVFYFHGKSNEHFTLLSDNNLQINARFIGLRPAGRSRDFTWIQALGILFGSHTFTVEAVKAETWSDEDDHLKFSYDGKDIALPEGYPSIWVSSEDHVKVERSSAKNSALITLPEVAEISVNVVPVTEEDDRIHGYNIPSDDCYAHFEVQFRFYGLSRRVEGVLGKTYRPDYVSSAKAGVAMPVVGGEDKYRTLSLVSADCKLCVFSPAGELTEEDSSWFDEHVEGRLDCANGWGGGNGIVCRK